MTYVCLFYLNSLNGIRQSLGVAIVLWGIKYIHKEEPVKYILTCIFASLFHTSALSAIVIYVIHRYVSLKYIPVIIISIVLCYTFVLDIFSQIGFYAKISDHLLELQGEDKDGGGGIYQRYFMIFITVVMYLLARIKRLRINYNLFSVITIGFIPPFLLGSHFGMRIAEYFFIFLCILIPQILSKYSTKIKMLYIIGIMCYFLLLIMAGAKQKRASFLPYNTIFNIENVRRPQFRQP